MQLSYLKKISVYAIAALAVLNSCSDDTVWSPQVAAPLVNSELNVYDVLARTNNEDLIVIDQNTGLLALVYEGDLISFSGNEILQIPNQNAQAVGFLTSSEINTLNNSNTVSKSVTVTAPFDPGDPTIELDSILFKAGSVDVNISSEIRHNGSLRIEIPALTKNGAGFDETINFTYSGTSPITASGSYSLADYKADLTQGPNNINELNITYTMSFTNSGQATTIADFLTIDQVFSNMQFNVVHGYFGQQVVSQDADSIAVKLFNNALDGNIRFTDPRVSLSIHNSYGMPVLMELTKLATYNVNTNTTIPILYSNFPNPFTIPFASVPGLIKDTTVVLDTSNSTVQELVTPAPKFLISEINATANPANNSAIRNFITDSSKIEISSELYLPLTGYAGEFVLQDTFPFNFGQNNIDFIEAVQLRTIITNGFPVDAAVQVYFVDDANVILDSLVADPTDFIVQTGEVDANGRVVKSTEKVTDLVMGQDRVPNLSNATKIVVKGSAQTTDYNGTNTSKEIKIYDDYTMKIQMGAKIDGKIDGNTTF